jgi:hypothetical protein
VTSSAIGTRHIALGVVNNGTDPVANKSGNCGNQWGQIPINLAVKVAFVPSKGKGAGGV